MRQPVQYFSRPIAPTVKSGHISEIRLVELEKNPGHAKVESLTEAIHQVIEKIKTDLIVRRN